MLTLSEGRRVIPTNPWHILGKEVDSGLMTVDDALELSQSNDEVTPINIYDPEGEVIDGFMGIHSSIYGVLNVASPDYEITQRREILELAYEIVGLNKTDAKVDAVGTIKNGKVFFAYISAPDLVIDPNGIADTIEKGLYCATSFDGSLPNIFGYSLIRPVCTNVLTVAFKSLQQAIKVRHTRFAEDRIREAAVALGYLGAVEKEMIKTAERLLTKPGEKSLEKVLDHLWPLDDEELSERGYARRSEVRGRVRSLYKGPLNTAVDKVGENGYAVYQAFTEYLDHHRIVHENGGTENRAMGSVFPGRVQNQKMEVANLILN
jgi:phage/plasmid-like protein (TIGR03299 family)